MRIAQIAPLAESVPPKLYGGTERVVAWLVDELVELGHEVTLFASGDSRTREELHAVWPRALRLGRPRVDPNTACTLLIEAVSRRAREFDVIHAHIDWLHLPALSRGGSRSSPRCTDASICLASARWFGNFGRRASSRFPTTSFAGRPISALLRSRDVPRLLGTAHAGQGARGRHPDRAGGRHAAADRCEGASRRSRLLQEADPARYRWD
jgi:glycosyltransferase involved in cell wall biosynthesis